MLICYQSTHFNEVGFLKNLVFKSQTKKLV